VRQHPSTVLPESSMNAYTTTGVETSGTTEGGTDTEHDVDEELVFMTGIFGVDAEGYDHRYSRVRDEVYRTCDGDLERVVDLEHHDVQEYITFVERSVGWADEWFFETGTCGIEGAQRLADAREETRTEDEQ
jgi:hypothetical protein